MHTIHAAAPGVSCSCGYKEDTKTRNEADKLAKKHADENKPSYIEPRKGDH